MLIVSYTVGLYWAGTSKIFTCNEVKDNITGTSYLELTMLLISSQRKLATSPFSVTATEERLPWIWLDLQKPKLLLWNSKNNINIITTLTTASMLDLLVASVNGESTIIVRRSSQKARKVKIKGINLLMPKLKNCEQKLFYLVFHVYLGLINTKTKF